MSGQAVHGELIVFVQERDRHVVRDGRNLGHLGGKQGELMPGRSVAQERAAPAEEGNSPLQQRGLGGSIAVGIELPRDVATLVDARSRPARAGGDRWSSILLGIVKSTPFQMRRSEP